MKIKVLFVCYGNICRSPSAEAVFNGYIKNKNSEKRFFVDSAGIIDYHEGEPADPRMQIHAKKRGYNLTSVSRPVKPEDFDKFDYIIGMDNGNVFDLKDIARSNNKDENKIFLMTQFSKRYNYDGVPDPYYGGEEGFELVLDLLEDAVEGFYEFLDKEKK
jgi:protein-tyrosine phosphatase